MMLHAWVGSVFMLMGAASIALTSVDPFGPMKGWYWILFIAGLGLLAASRQTRRNGLRPAIVLLACTVYYTLCWATAFSPAGDRNLWVLLTHFAGGGFALGLLLPETGWVRTTARAPGQPR